MGHPFTGHWQSILLEVPLVDPGQSKPTSAPSKQIYKTSLQNPRCWPLIKILPDINRIGPNLNIVSARPVGQVRIFLTNKITNQIFWYDCVLIDTRAWHVVLLLRYYPLFLLQFYFDFISVRLQFHFAHVPQTGACASTYGTLVEIANSFFGK